MKITKEGFAVLANDSHISKWVEQSGRLDHDENAVPVICSHIKKGDIVFDLGAFIGDHAIAYARAGAKVMAFEPNPIAFECLEYNMQNIHNVFSAMLAFSDKEARYSVVLPNDNIGMATIVVDEYSATKTTTIDQYCKEWEIYPDFIKIDCEGKEVDILKGARGVINTHCPKLVIEVNESALLQHGTSREELFKLLDDYGYVYADIYGKNLENLHTQFDIICFKR